MSKLEREVSEHVRAGFAGIYVTTNEPDDAQRDIMLLCQSENWKFYSWDADSGLSGIGDDGKPYNDPDAIDPAPMLKALIASVPDHQPTILVMRYFHRMLTDNVGLITTVESVLRIGKGKDFHLVILAHDIALPCELARSFVVLDHALPTREELQEIGIDLEETYPGVMPQGAELGTLLDAAQGLTRGEAENAYSLSIIRHKRIRPDEVFSLKAKALTKTGSLSLYTGNERFDSLGGLDDLKLFVKRELTPNPKRKKSPQGILLLGVPGTGKTVFAKAAGREVGIPTVIMDVGSLMGSLVGETERKTREAIATINAMGKCIVFLDEVDKALAGTTGGANDSGVSSRMLGTLLSWLADPAKQAYVIVTSNKIENLPSALFRPGRFDALYFLDYPTREQKDLIWSMYAREYEVDISEIPADDYWTGAEIHACCKTANSQDISVVEASRYLIPVSSTGASENEELRKWATGKCLDANRGGKYQRDPGQSEQAKPAQGTSKPARKLSLD